MSQAVAAPRPDPGAPGLDRAEIAARSDGYSIRVLTENGAALAGAIVTCPLDDAAAHVSDRNGLVEFTSQRRVFAVQAPGHVSLLVAPERNVPTDVRLSTGRNVIATMRGDDGALLSDRSARLVPPITNEPDAASWSPDSLSALSTNMRTALLRRVERVERTGVPDAPLNAPLAMGGKVTVPVCFAIQDLCAAKLSVDGHVLWGGLPPMTGYRWMVGDAHDFAEWVAMPAEEGPRHVTVPGGGVQPRSQLPTALSAAFTVREDVHVSALLHTSTNITLRVWPPPDSGRDVTIAISRVLQAQYPDARITDIAPLREQSTSNPAVVKGITPGDRLVVVTWPVGRDHHVASRFVHVRQGTNDLGVLGSDTSRSLTMRVTIEGAEGVGLRALDAPRAHVRIQSARRLSDPVETSVTVGFLVALDTETTVLGVGGDRVFLEASLDDPAWVVENARLRLQGDTRPVELSLPQGGAPIVLKIPTKPLLDSHVEIVAPDDATDLECIVVREGIVVLRQQVLRERGGQPPLVKVDTPLGKDTLVCVHSSGGVSGYYAECVLSALSQQRVPLVLRPAVGVSLSIVQADAMSPKQLGIHWRLSGEGGELRTAGLLSFPVQERGPTVVKGLPVGRTALVFGRVGNGQASAAFETRATSGMQDVRLTLTPKR